MGMMTNWDWIYYIIIDGMNELIICIVVTIYVVDVMFLMHIFLCVLGRLNASLWSIQSVAKRNLRKRIC